MKKAILVFIFCSLLCQAALAVLPPEYYRQKIQDSRVKAIAQVERVDVIAHARAVDTQKVTFSTINDLGIETPAIFTGICYAVNKRSGNIEPMVSGTVYHYPVLGDKAYVTISSDGGSITSYTVLTPDLENALLHDPESVELGIGKVRVRSRQ